MSYAPHPAPPLALGASSPLTALAKIDATTVIPGVRLDASYWSMPAKVTLGQLKQAWEKGTSFLNAARWYGDWEAAHPSGHGTMLDWETYAEAVVDLAETFRSYAGEEPSPSTPVAETYARRSAWSYAEALVWRALAAAKASIPLWTSVSQRSATFAANADTALKRAQDYRLLAVKVTPVARPAQRAPQPAAEPTRDVEPPPSNTVLIVALALVAAGAGAAAWWKFGRKAA